MFLCDADVMIDVIRQHPPAVAWFDDPATTDVVLPGIVWMELVEGCKNKLALQRLRKTMAGVRVVLPDEAAQEYAITLLERFNLSHGLEKYDALVAVTALALGEKLNTFNLRHYRFIPGLKLAQPYTR